MEGLNHGLIALAGMVRFRAREAKVTLRLRVVAMDVKRGLTRETRQDVRAVRDEHVTNGKKY